MTLPRQDEFIDIHTHGARSTPGIFIVRNLMAHEDEVPVEMAGTAFTAGIHPWHLDDVTLGGQLGFIRKAAEEKRIIAIGEAGFDRLRGAGYELQKRAFDGQISIAESYSLPVVIHCVKAWDVLLEAHKKLKPATPWLVHGFRGKKELAGQLLSRGMYISFWFDFIIRGESSELVRSLPADRIFFETDGAGIDIISIYRKVADDLGVTPAELKTRVYNNFIDLFTRGRRPDPD